jgi:hypothetical protein
MQRAAVLSRNAVRQAAASATVAGRRSMSIVDTLKKVFVFPEGNNP